MSGDRQRAEAADGSRQCVLFTKLLKGLELDEVGRIARELDFDGIDLLVRPGHQVVPTDPDGIRAAVRTLKGYGLAVPAITTDIADPDAAPTEAIFASCAEAGVGLVRLGYWNYRPGADYRELRDRARRHLDTIETLARRHGVKPMIQLHGGTIHSSGSLTAALLEGRDPAVLGAYPDPGNMVVQDGREDWRLTFDLLSPWLCFVGVKNGGWSFGAQNENGQRQWTSDWLGVADGMVPWDAVLGWLQAHHPAVPLSFHSHYEVPLPQAIEQTRTDLRYVRHLLGGTQRSGEQTTPAPVPAQPGR